MREVIIALDFPGKEETFQFLNQFQEEKPFVKVGMELFYKEGKDMVEEIKRRGHKVFLDLKLHDIPTTVEKAIASLNNLNVDVINVHGVGGVKMMEAAKRGMKEGPLLIAVTQLTSTSRETMNQELSIGGSMEEVVCKYARNAKKAGLSGVVCSPLEVKAIRHTCGQDFITVTPGIRLEGEALHDQVRITTPKKAGQLGATYIVMGRTITRSEDPVSTYRRCQMEFGGK